MFPLISGLQKSIDETLELNKKLIQGFSNMTSIKEIDIGTTPKELVYEEDKIKLYHYTPMVKNPHSIPVLVTYALVNKQYVLDLHEDRSIVKNWLETGLDVYMIDWGYPDHIDKFLTMEDYVDDYINNSVDFIRKQHNLDKINLLGICQGATLATIYTALYPEKIKNFVSLVMPFDFSTDDGLLFSWSKSMDIDSMINSFSGLVPGDVMNNGFNMLKPFQLSVDKYLDFIDKLDDKEAILDFLRMEQWIYDSPDQAGPMLSKFINDLYKENKLINNQLELGGRTVNLKNIDMPVLCILAQKDHLVAPASTRPFINHIASIDKTLLEFPVGHIGMFVSSKAQKEVAPAISNWLKERGDKGSSKQAKPAAKKSASEPKEN
ncbi:poly-beta-hydroxybutyrate polymerase [Clostridium homopropionicum DSM 5847]|uniref:Poly(3-hydroxyalkanoate) polymerase subunit PhaC n=1 Tax=Clostridium homopropionicum DSM 5847 TaxID=1121318 RepID=A0A0L6Z5A2_9CLOT|nr:class III poly(R)-hydroxyalkanoic acid synthase subunit PhaC [Clostridium homopropionicum]KOA18136.1 poly-beta-hydroxybutyrate polymerase [Clostridium homopropionicum DSM 5847]SFG96561.1 polyhydroxyalkanoate synthase [Clostridium homopropionicum]